MQYSHRMNLVRVAEQASVGRIGMDETESVLLTSSSLNFI